MTYEQWNQARRLACGAFSPEYEDIQVWHGEYESTVTYGPVGYVVASWCQATGTGRYIDPDTIAEELVEAVTNYLRNALR